MRIQTDVSLKPFNSFGVDAHGKYFVVLKSEDALQSAHSPTLLLGGGSNLLFTKDFDGLVVKNEIKGVRVLEAKEDSVLVEVGGGEMWHDFVLTCIEHQWGGVENLSLIPGTVGAAPVQNIGAYGVELKDVFHSLRAWDMVKQCFVEFNKEDCLFGYRSSIFKTKYKNNLLITSVVFNLSSQLIEASIMHPTIKDVSNAVIQIRKSKLPDPKEIGNAGSFFKNPVVHASQLAEIRRNFPDLSAHASETGFKIAAAWLIEQAGWKGYRDGNVGCHAKQALVLVNYGGASGIDILKLSQKIQDSVYSMFGIMLEAEVNIL
jgi:UDP-N-acetylmuramate dehydrogenase